jgi:PAS domain S-box-containing protein
LDRYHQAGDAERPRPGPTPDPYRLIEHSSDYVVALDAEGRISFVSPSVERDFGYRAAELVGRPAVELLHPDDMGSVAAALSDSIARHRDPMPVDVRVRTRNGDYRTIEMLARNLLDDPAVAAIVVNGREVGERRRAEARFRAAFDSSAIGMAFVGPDGSIVDVNGAFARMLGYAPEELRGRGWVEITHPEDVDADLALAREVFAGERASYQLEKRYLRKDGTPVWGRLTASLVADREAGARLGLALVEDISAERQAKEARASAERRYRTLVEAMPAVTYVWESSRVPAGGDVTYTSPQIERLLGYTAQEWERPGMWVERLHPDDRETVLASAARSERDGTPFSMEYRYLARDGRTVWVRDEAILVERSPEGVPWRFQGVMMDVTARKRAEESLAETTERLQAILEGSPLAIITDDLDGIVMSWNPAAEAVFGWTAEEATGSFLPHVPPERRGEFERLRDRVVETGAAVDMTVVRRRKDGSPVDVELSAGPMLDSSGRIVGLTAILVDVTEAREARRRLAEAERRYRTLVEGLPAVTYLDRIHGAGESVGYEPMYVSPQVEAIFGYSRERWQSELLWESMLHPDDRARVLAFANERVGLEQPIDQEYRVIAADGRVVWIREQSAALREGEELFWQGVMYDVTQAKETEFALRAAEARFRTLVEQIPAVTFAADHSAEHRSLYISPQVRDLLGVEAEAAMLDRGLFVRHIHPDDSTRVADAWEHALRLGRPFEAEYRVVHEDGRIRWVWERSSVVLSGEGSPVVQGVLFDVTDRKQAEEVLRESEAEVRRSLEVLRRADEERRELLRHIVASEAAERGRLAAGIEDRSLQDMTALGLRLETLRRGLEDPEQQGALDRLGETVQQALARLRHLLVELRPRELETGGLGAALQQYGRTVASAGTVTVRNRLAHDPEPEIRALAYRIAQEAISLALKRSTTGDVTVDIEGRDGGTLVAVGCEGRSTAWPDDEPGVVSMRERAQVAGGWLRVAASPGEGSELEFWLPGRPAGAP